MEKQFISVDWGTTNFRMRLIETATMRIVEEVQSGLGVKVLYKHSQETGKNREEVFIEYLNQQVSKFQLIEEDTKSMIISGMASSTMGLQNLPYSNLPFKANGADIITEKIKPDNLDFSILLISGVQSFEDVMRGEETQMIGLADNLQTDQVSVIILPGTHSKHIFYQGGKFTDFKTFMTGELFSMVAEHTILANSVSEGKMNEWEKKAFQLGVTKAGQGGNLLHELFAIRARDLLGKSASSENYYFLSGLMIGYEMQDLRLYKERQIYLYANGVLEHLYMLAAETLEISVELLQGNAVIHGQWNIYQSQK